MQECENLQIEDLEGKEVDVIIDIADGVYQDDVMVPVPVTVMVEQNAQDSSSEDGMSCTDADYTEKSWIPKLESSRRSTGSKRPSLQCSSMKFKDKSSILSSLLQSRTTRKTVPRGLKIGKSFVLVDERTESSRGRGRKIGKCHFQFDEYQGKFENISQRKHNYLYRDREFKYIDYLGGKYHSYEPCPGSKGSKKLMAVQPKLEEILVMHKYYGEIPGILRRRVCKIDHFPEGVEPKQHNLIFVEYSEAPPESKRLKIDTESLRLQVVSRDYSQINHLETSAFEEQDEILRLKINGVNNGAFFSRDQAIEILMNADASLDEIPQGIKENVYFIISNEDNHQRELEGKRKLYIDDCGVWKGASLVSQRFVKVENSYAHVDYCDGKYTFKNTQHRLHYEAPTESDVLIMRRVYACLKRNEEYKRRIIWIDTFPEDAVPQQRHIALVEYIGKYPGQEEPHGNEKRENAAPYMRTPLSVVKKMKELLVNKTAKEAMDDALEIGLSPRSMSQFHSMRHRSSYRIGPGSARDENNTKELREILTMVQTNSFVQHATYLKYRSPMVIGHTSQQINSWKYHCQERSGLPRVLGVDRTINVGPVCLTILTYPHPNLFNRKTGDQAIMMGPVFFHVEKSWHTFSLLFNHLKMCLATVDKADVDHIGIACPSEEEKPIVQALKINFPNSATTFCAEHLKTDFRAFLQSRGSLGGNATEDLANEIFSELMACTEEYDFDVKLLQLQSDYDISIPQFGVYFRKLRDNLGQSLWRPAAEQTTLLQWSSETCIALQDLMSSAQTWGRKSLPELILKVQEVIQQQEQGEILAIHDEGAYQLAPHAKKYYFSKSDYAKKNHKEKARVAENMRKFKPGVGRSSAPKVEEDNVSVEDHEFY